MTRLVYRPIDSWTDPVTSNRQPSKFSASWDDTVQLLRREVEQLNRAGADVLIVVQLDVVSERDIKQDERLHANYRTNSPKVVVSFDSRHGPLRYACDTFDTWRHSREAWQQNVRAIAKGLEALRLISRYGIGQRGEQYTGFGALPPGTPMPAAKMTAADARRIFDGRRQHPTEDDKSIYRRAAKLLHPDTGSVPNPVEFSRLTEAYDLLTSSGAPS